MAFDFNTIENFDKHIDLSIPNYLGMLNHILSISSYFIKNNSKVYDFGCSTGNLILKLREYNKHLNVDYIGIDNAPNMASNNDFIQLADLTIFEPQKHCFSTLIFTLQFLKFDNRLPLLQKIYNSLDINGALIISEKTFAKDSFIQDIFSFTYYDFKLKNFTEKEILQKQFDLRYLMQPLSEKENIQLFKKAGFSKIEKFWQSLQFKAWVLIKK